MTKWQPIKSAPLDTHILLTDGKAVHLATLKASWVFSEAPKPVIALGGQHAVANQYFGALKAFEPTHWHSITKLPVVKP